MPDSLRDLLHRRAADGSGPSRDLTSGALRRARVIGRRRLAAGAVGAVAGIAIAGLAAAALIQPLGGDDTAPPAVEPSVTDSPSLSESPSEEGEETVESSAAGCGAADPDWGGWGDSDSIGPLTELPEELYVALRHDEGVLQQVHRYDGGGHDYVFESEIGDPMVSPDGNRALVPYGCDVRVELLDESAEPLEGFGVDGIACPPSWSPDSNAVTVTAMTPEYDVRYLLDLATGEQTPLPEEVSCSPRWSADGAYLLDHLGRFALTPDGGDRVELRGSANWAEGADTSGLSSISADLGLACFQLDDPEYIASGHISPWRCDRLVDTDGGEELALPVATSGTVQVVFGSEGEMIVADHDGSALALTLLDASGTVVDERVLDVEDWSRALLVGYYTG